MKIFLVIFFLCFISFPVLAQDKNPIEVTADNELSWNRSAKSFTASGNAKIIQGDNSISAPTITAHYNEGDSIVIQQVVAETNATLTQPDQTLTARKVTANFETGELSTVTAINNVVLKTENEVLYGDKAVYNATDRVITVTGDVRIEQDRNIMTGNKATFDMKTNISTMTAGGSSGGRVKAIFYSEASE